MITSEKTLKMENQPQVAVPENDSDMVVIDQNDVDSLKKNLETTLAQKIHWREKAKKDGAEKAELLKQIEAFKNASKPLESTEKPKETVEVSSFDSIADNLSAIRDLSSDELTSLRQGAKELGTDPIKYIKSRAGQALLKELRAESKSKEATPTSSSKVLVFNNRPVDDILKDDTVPMKYRQAAYEAKMKRKVSNQAM